jgi:hypothetical protein
MQTINEHKTVKTENVKWLKYSFLPLDCKELLSFFLRWCNQLILGLRLSNRFLRNIFFYFDLLQLKKKIPELISIVLKFYGLQNTEDAKLKSIQNLFWDWSIILADYIIWWSRYLNSLSWVSHFSQSPGGMFF